MKRAGITLCMLGTLLWATSSVAGTLSSEDFERLSEGSLDISGGAEGQYWVSEEAEYGSMGDLAVVKAYAQGAAKPANNAGGLKYLAVDTGAPLQRYVQAGGNALDVGSKGIYFEGDVQFTPYDGETTVGADASDKLLVYLQVKESDDENGNVTATTNFVVVAGYYDMDNASTATNYVCAVPTNFDANAWHRLVVKTRLLDKRVVFKVVVDGVPLEVDVKKGDEYSAVEDLGANEFPSLKTTGNDKAKMASVGFKGQGSIDNITWTNDDPAPIAVKYVFKWDPDDGSPVVKVNGVEKTIENGKEISFNETDTLEYVFNAVAGKTADEPDVTKANGVTTITFKVKSAGIKLVIDGVTEYVGDFETAVAKLSEGVNAAGGDTTNITVVITLLADCSAAEVSQDDGVCLAPTNAVLDLNGFNLTITGAGFFGNETLLIKDSGTTTTNVLTADMIYAPDFEITGGRFSVEPTTDDDATIRVPAGKKLGEVESHWELVDAGSEPEPSTPTVSGGTGTVEGSTIKITAPADDGTVTIEGNASGYTIEVPANVTTINGKVGTVTVKVTVETGTVDITGAFKTTKSGDTTTIALDPDGSVKVNGKTIKVKPELVDASETEVPFAVAGGAATAKVKAIPGLTYVLKAATDLAKVRTQEATEAAREVAGDSGTVELKDSEASESTKFYVIEVTREVTR